MARKYLIMWADCLHSEFDRGDDSIEVLLTLKTGGSQNMQLKNFDL